METAEKESLYDEAHRAVAELLTGLTDPIAAMASCAAVLHERIPKASWTGFYRVVGPAMLRIGPYQGPIGCLEIPFDRGVCGASASRRETLVVEDVHAFAGHIACDPRARSEIVVPVVDESGTLQAVLDIDSHEPSAFDESDQRGLERIVGLLAPCFGAA